MSIMVTAFLVVLLIIIVVHYGMFMVDSLEYASEDGMVGDIIIHILFVSAIVLAALALKEAISS